jgi:hypothetical protein
VTRFVVKEGKKGPRTPEPRVRCRACEARLGVAVRAELIQLRIGANLNDSGRIVGGSRVWVCGRCWARGEFTPMGN